ncbi:helix-turn-helix domain-containing protein [Mesorhizobium sp. Z1-4]|uniref:LexA family transcriptional regulator n=1 Tax=Mesorhizobium sp. Z1-4 TaxID=2448478 RepID=UPI001FE0CA5F|nr:helix-turn-helix domain-containing protein [Mesorhizobium sp. Z1-4]
MQEKIRHILRVGGETQSQLAQRVGVSQSTVNRWLTGSEPEGHNRDVINGLYATLATDVSEIIPSRSVPLVGYLGAGGEVDPDFEQVPSDGLDQIELPFPLPDDMVAFKVRGTSMLPVYRPDTVIVTYREQKKPIESFFGFDAAIRTDAGRRYIKTINRGSTPGLVNLISWNDPVPIEDVRPAWIGEIFAVLPPAALRKVDRQGGIQGQLSLRAG